MELQERKHPRLKEYDYGENGAYFITFCTESRKHLLGTVIVYDVSPKDIVCAVGRDALIPPQVRLSEYGEIVRKNIENTNNVYANVLVDHYAIMPNHVHLLLRIENADGGMRASRPTAIQVVKAIKTLTSREIGHSIWQNSCYDHVIRNQKDYDEIWNYIENNPVRWTEDEYYCEESR